MSEFDFVAALMELQANDSEGYELVVETILRLRENQNEKEQ